MRLISAAVKGKRVFNFLRRGVYIANRYDVTPARMGRALAHFSPILHRFGCNVTLPIGNAKLLIG